MKAINLISLGCSKNLVDSEHMLGILAKAGFSYQPKASETDAVIINTCAFLQSSVKESLDTIMEAIEMKAKGITKRVVVTGCLTQRYQGDLKTELPEVDLFLGTGNFHQIATYLNGMEAGGIDRNQMPTSLPDPDFLYDHNTPRLQATLPHTAYVKVSEGCSRSCTFCIIPKLRGPLRSRTIDSLLQEVTGLAEQGVREVNLIAQDLTAYGKDLRPKLKLNDLLRELAQIDKIDWIRLHYAYPHGFDHDLMQTIATHKKLLSYIDMPLQHIDDELLSAMRRQTREASVRQLLHEMRQTIPDLTLRTTFIVGFPGESEAAYAKLLDFVAEQKFERLGVFTYSREPGTPAAELPGQVSDSIKKRRWEKLMALQQKVSLAVNLNAVGKVTEALIEQALPSPQQYIARIPNQAPEVDGKTMVQSDQPLKVGSIIPVKIVGASHYDLVAAALPNVA